MHGTTNIKFRDSIVTVCGLAYLCIPLTCLKSRAYAVTFITVVSIKFFDLKGKVVVIETPSREF